MSTRDIMGNIQAFCDETPKEVQLDFFPQEECPDDVYHVQCHHCGGAIDPNVDPVYCWNYTTVGGGAKQIFVCGGCDAEHRVTYKVQKWRSDNIKTTSTVRGDRNAS